MNRMLNFFGGNRGQGNGGPSNIFAQFQQFMQNPIGAIMNSGINVPQNMQNNPEAIVNYLRSSGQMTDDQFNQVSQMANMAQGMFGLFGKKS